MKNQGISDEEITNKLREQRISPKEINDALSQSKIKSAVTDDDTQGMQPSIMSSSQDKKNTQDIYTPQPQEEAPAPIQETYAQEPEYQEEYYPQQGYEEYSPATTDTDTMIEIAEQVFSEKIHPIQAQLENLNEFQNLTQVKIDSISQRLKRIETIIDNLQISILDKVGSYSKNLDNLQKEMNMMQDSFKKLPKTKKISK